MSDSVSAAAASPEVTTALTLSGHDDDEASIFALAKLSGNPLAFFQEMGKMAAQSGMLGVKTPSQGVTLMLMCACEKTSPFAVKRTFHLMEDGQITMRADAMLAKFRAIGGDYRIVQRDANGAAVEMTYRGQPAIFSFSWEEAQQEPFVYAKDGKTIKHNYATPRGRMQMLWARVVSDGVRALAPEVVAGVYTPEEMDDGGTEPRASTPARKQAVAKPAVTLPATTATEAIVESQGEIVDAEFSVTNDDAPPFDAQAATSATAATTPTTAHGLQATLMEIELHLGELGMTRADLETRLAAKWPGEVATLDDLSPERAGQILENLRGNVAKKRQTAQAV